MTANRIELAVPSLMNLNKNRLNRKVYFTWFLKMYSVFVVQNIQTKHKKEFEYLNF